MTKSYTAILSSPLGLLGIQTSGAKLIRMDFLPGSHQPVSPKDAFTKQIHQELEFYFKNPHHRFIIPCQTDGTIFQQSVWQALKKIPVGTTLTYGELATHVNTSPRAIGNACRANPIPIIIPCHRVAAKNHIGGYVGKTEGTFLDIKKWLLQHEGI